MELGEIGLPYTLTTGVHKRRENKSRAKYHVHFDSGSGHQDVIYGVEEAISEIVFISTEPGVRTECAEHDLY